MKKNSLIIGFIFITLFTTTLFGQFNQPGMKFYPIETEIRNAYTRYDTIPAPEWEFITLPTELMTSYYDYMPGGYKSHPIRLQTENGNGVYITFHGQTSPSNNLRQHWAYVFPDSSIDFGVITINNWQGYGSIDVHSESGDCIACWQEDSDGDDFLETPITYDDFDFLQFPGFWQLPPYIIENPEAPDSEFIFPLVYMGNSPLGDSLSRVYVLRTNIGILNGNVQIIYKDIQNPEEIIQPGWLDNQITNENGDPMFTDWCQQDIISYWSFALDSQYPGRIAFIGYAAYLEEPPNPPVEEGFFVYESLDYGETWTLYDFGMPPSIENLLQLEDNQGNVLDSIEVGIIGFNNTALYDGEGNLHWCYTGSYGYTDEDGNWNYFDHFIPACEFVWFGDDIVEWRNVWPPVPWEIDENGDTLGYWSNAVSTADSNLVFYENGQKQAVNLENGWMIQTWADGTALFWPYNPYIAIYVSASKDNGRHWTAPIMFGFYPWTILVYPYICDQIVDLGDGWGQVYMYYFDDNDYGSYIQGQGPPTGGQITYCSFKINFDDIAAVDEEQEMPSPKILLYNYPNPFSGSTSISFFTAENTEDTEIRIYNIKGQLVKQFKIQNSKFKINEIEWDGKDESCNELTNGIYLYKLLIGNETIETKKCLLFR